MSSQSSWTRPAVLVSLMLVSIGLALGILWLSQRNPILEGKVPGDVAFGGFVLLSAICLSSWANILYQSWRRRGLFQGNRQKGSGFLAKLALIGRWHFGLTFALLLVAIVALYLVSFWFLASGMLRILWGRG
jgi:hypothetical protein